MCQLAFQCQHVWFMPCLIYDVLWKRTNSRSSSSSIWLKNIFWGNIFIQNIYLNCITSHMHKLHSTMNMYRLWDVKQMICVHDYLKLMDKIWPLSALHLHHRRTSTNDRSRTAELLILYTVQQFCFLSQFTAILHS